MGNCVICNDKYKTREGMVDKTTGAVESPILVTVTQSSKKKLVKFTVCNFHFRNYEVFTRKTKTGLLQIKNIVTQKWKTVKGESK